MQTGGHLSSGVSAARSAAEGRGMERLADGDEGVGVEAANEEWVVISAVSGIDKRVFE